MRIACTMLGTGVCWTLLACASAPQPAQHLATAQAAVRAAKEVGANEVPQAQLHAQLAQEQVDHATKLIEDGDNERADSVLRRATADAELAVALARQATAQKQAEAAEAEAGPQPSAPTPNIQATNQ